MRTRRLLTFASVLALLVPAACSSGGSTMQVTDGSGSDAPAGDADGGADGDARDSTSTDGPPDTSTDGAADAEAGAPVSINVTGDHCPTVGAAASPPSAVVGQSLSISAQGVDEDGDSLSYRWTASSGTFSSPDSSMGRYTCEQAGEQILTIAVSDGRCSADSVLPVTCTSGP